ncbi:EcsC family protein [Rudanella paleaurantiibacter]|uniref:EcsC family protein n=1 Tax=Rudanella paleaurantiibacter TaxID=2614655 RepID=A0A7J5TZZ1_9BACT|nr:EcsC family protein [Rudanella paleaurantiibacter]KAB7731063.1 EcsC family protein [Rudanella paleaurantiibacter]
MPATPLYDTHALGELSVWQHQMRQPPSLANRLSKGLQNRVNRLIPQRVHDLITGAIKHMTRAVLAGSEFTAPSPSAEIRLERKEEAVRNRIVWYKRVGAAEGGVTGAGGILLGLADFPLLLSLKMKMLYDIAALYGYDVSDYRERLFVLHIFQLAFSSQERRQAVFAHMEQWHEFAATLPDDIHQFDWQTFQQEYRDYIDLAKLLQLVPGIGAVVGVVANWRLLDQLGETAMMAYRMRWASKRAIE